MSGPKDLEDLNISLPGGFDPFADEAAAAAEEEAEDAQNVTTAKGKAYVHVRVQQRNGRKSLTTVQGIDSAVDYKKVLKALKKEFCCNGCVVEDPEHGTVIQLQGDQRNNVSQFLINEGLCKRDDLKIHGF